MPWILSNAGFLCLDVYVEHFINSSHMCSSISIVVATFVGNTMQHYTSWFRVRLLLWLEPLLKICQMLRKSCWCLMHSCNTHLSMCASSYATLKPATSCWKRWFMALLRAAWSERLLRHGFSHESGTVKFQDWVIFQASPCACASLMATFCIVCQVQLMLQRTHAHSSWPPTSCYTLGPTLQMPAEHCWMTCHCRHFAAVIQWATGWLLCWLAHFTWWAVVSLGVCVIICYPVVFQVYHCDFPLHLYK